MPAGCPVSNPSPTNNYNYCGQKVTISSDQTTVNPLKTANVVVLLVYACSVHLWSVQAQMSIHVKRYYFYKINNVKLAINTAQSAHVKDPFAVM